MTKYDGNVTRTGTTTTKANRVLKRWVVLAKNSLGEDELDMHFFYPVSLRRVTFQERFALGYTLVADGQVVGHVSEISTNGVFTG